MTSRTESRISNSLRCGVAKSLVLTRRAAVHLPVAWFINETIRIWFSTQALFLKACQNTGPVGWRPALFTTAPRLRPGWPDSGCIVWFVMPSFLSLALIFDFGLQVIPKYIHFQEPSHSEPHRSLVSWCECQLDMPIPRRSMGVDCCNTMLLRRGTVVSEVNLRGGRADGLYKIRLSGRLESIGKVEVWHTLDRGTARGSGTRRQRV
jgi:hypothetical protein